MKVQMYADTAIFDCISMSFKPTALANLLTNHNEISIANAVTMFATWNDISFLTRLGVSPDDIFESETISESVMYGPHFRYQLENFCDDDCGADFGTSFGENFTYPYVSMFPQKWFELGRFVAATVIPGLQTFEEIEISSEFDPRFVDAATDRCNVAPRINGAYYLDRKFGPVFAKSLSFEAYDKDYLVRITDPN